MTTDNWQLTIDPTPITKAMTTDNWQLTIDPSPITNDQSAKIVKLFKVLQSFAQVI